MSRRKEGQHLQPTAFVASTCNAEDVTTHCSNDLPALEVIPHQMLMAINGLFVTRGAESEAQHLQGLECDVEVEGRPAIATRSCWSPLNKWQGCVNALSALSWLPYMSCCADIDFTKIQIISQLIKKYLEKRDIFSIVSGSARRLKRDFHQY